MLVHLYQPPAGVRLVRFWPFSGDHLAANVESCCQNFHMGVTGVSEGRFGLPHCFCYTWNMFAPCGNRY